MSQSRSYMKLSQTEQRNETQNDHQLSLTETSDEATSTSQDSLDLVLVEIGHKRKVRRKRRRRKMGRIQNFEGAESYEELVGSAKKKRQFLILGGLCALAVIVIAAIVISVVLVNKSSNNDDHREALKLDDILSGGLQPRRFNGTWIDDNSYHYFDMNGNFVVYNVTGKKADILIELKNNEKFFLTYSQEFSPDKKFILTASSYQKIFRHSFLALWDVYNVETKVTTAITIGGSTGPQQPLQLVKFSPIDNSMIIVHMNNIYYKKSPTDPEIQITTDGSGNIYNGVPDWVYEEEVFSSNSATWFSPDAKKIAFIRFDDTKVPVMSLPEYGRVGDANYQYPKQMGVKYPKAAAPNPEIKLFYVDLSSIQSQVTLHEIPVPSRFVNSRLDHLITSVSWATSNDLIAVFMNRVQSQGGITKCSTGTTPVCEEIMNLDVKDGWVEFFSAPFFNKAGSMMTFIWSNNKYRHVLSLDLNTKVQMPRTSGNFVVTSILSYNQEHNVILFTANLEGESKVQHIYAIKNEDNAVKVCLSCTPASPYNYFTAEVSKGGNHLVTIANGPDVPQVHMYSLKVDGNNISLTSHVEIESNKPLRERLEKVKLPKVVYDKIMLDNGSESQVMMFLPSNLDENAKYPMIVDVYGGPDSSSVTTRWSIEWGTYLASALNIIYAKIDGRGSGLQGDDNLFKLYRKLGTVEVEDQIQTAHKLHQKYSYIDSTRTAIWGWSYGGYAAGMSLATDKHDVYKCAVSVAPVTDWALYDSIYTERYMGLPIPEDNELGYAGSRLMNYAENLRNKSYMLVHGTLDDNVHFQQGMLLARTLELKDIQFKEISYPDEDHSLSHVRPHLYHSLERFFKTCFNMST